MKKFNLIAWSSAKAEVVSGKFEVYNNEVDEDLESWAKGDISCMVFDPDSEEVRMTGVITESNNPENIGKYAIWVADDNGQAMIEAAKNIGYGLRIGNPNFSCEVGFDLEDFGADICQNNEGNFKDQSRDCFRGLSGNNEN